MTAYEKKLQQLLATADIKINDGRPWDMQVKNPQTFQRIFKETSLGAGESYMDGWWDCDALEEFFFRVTRYLNARNIYNVTTLVSVVLKHFLINQQSRTRASLVAKQHYDLDNQLYEAMLGESMAYTCGYWRNAQTLDEAQFAKYDLICKKLELQPGEKVLELGCGWGGFARFAAEKYQVAVTAVNLSVEQMKFAKTLCQGLPVDLFVTDYRNVAEYNPQQIKFDKVVSIGMCEHVGARNYKKFLKIAHDNLKESGLFLMHTIGKNKSNSFTDPWIRKYIFPNGMLPSLKKITGKAENLFVIEDLHNFGYDYYLTLMAWFENFDRAWPQLKNRYDDRFYRMWKYYLLSCAGGFRSRSMQLWQFVMSPKGKLNGYTSIR